MYVLYMWQAIRMVFSCVLPASCHTAVMIKSHSHSCNPHPIMVCRLIICKPWCLRVSELIYCCTSYAGNPVFIMPRIDAALSLVYETTLNPAPVTLSSQNNKVGGVWEFNPDGSIRVSRLRCLEVAGAASQPGIRVQVADYWGTQHQHQLWMFDPAMGHLKPRHAPWLCLTAAYSSASSTALILWPCETSYGALGNPRQHWIWSTVA